MSVAGLLSELVDDAIDLEADLPPAAPPRDARRHRLSIRLQPGDIEIVNRRAGDRRLKPATYIAALVRAHLLADPPLPSSELAVLERATAELSAVGRNLNQITRAINSGAAVPAGTAALIGRSMALVETVRAATKDYVRAAVASWEAPIG